MTNDKAYRTIIGAMAKVADSMKIERLESQVRDLEQQRDEAGQRYVQAVRDLHEAQGRIAELGGELAQVQRQNEAAQQGFNQLLADNAHLRSCLRRVEWVSNGDYPPGDHCPACSWMQLKGNKHAADCWLADALKEGE